MDWMALITMLLQKFAESKTKKSFDSNEAGLRMLKARPIVARLAIRAALKEQGLRGIALHQGVQDVIDEMDKMSEIQVLAYFNSDQ